MIIGESTPLKKDYVTFLALALFVLVVIFEALLVVVVPLHLRSDRVWAREVAFQEMIQLEDFLRAKMIDYKKRTVYDKGNIGLLSVCLNQVADYLRDRRDEVDVTQIKAINDNLKKFETLYFDMEKKRFSIKVEKIDPSEFLKRLKRETECSDAVEEETK